MTEPPASGRDADEHAQRKTLLARMEADMAYFQARLEILGEPVTANQQAQRKVFKLLHKSLGDRVLKAKRRMIDGE
jgi:hypothetical protein